MPSTPSPSACVDQNLAQGRRTSACRVRCLTAWGSVDTDVGRLLSGMRRLPNSKNSLHPLDACLSTNISVFVEAKGAFRIHVAQGECGYGSD
jgi:hypothetical protein